MRIIEAFDKPIRTVTLSPDGRFLAAATENELAVFSQLTGEKDSFGFTIYNGSQFAFSAKSEGLVYSCRQSGLLWASLIAPTVGNGLQVVQRGLFPKGIAISPDGKTLVATRDGPQQQVELHRWSLPEGRLLLGFDYWSPFERLAFSPNGEFLAGINRESFELRIAVTGGINGRQKPRDTTSAAFLTFPRHGETVVFGWGMELVIMETRSGNVLRRVSSPDKPFVDAAFTGSGRHLATVDETDVMRVWSADSWGVVCEYDWGVGELTCIAVANDGLTGVCGTNNGRLIAFDVEE